MAKAMYASVGNTTKKIKKSYVVIDGIARKVKKVYAVVDGKTRLAFSGGGGTAINSGTTTEMTKGRAFHSGASIGDYAIFVKGMVSCGSYPYYNHQHATGIESYNNSLTYSFSNVYSITNARTAGVANVGDYALFAGGYTTASDENTDKQYTAYVDAINTSLTVTSKTSNLTLGTASSYIGASVGNYALFRWSSYTINTYNASLTKSTFNSSDYGRSRTTGASIGNYAIFAGGGNNTISSTCEVYNSSLTRTTISLTNRTYDAIGVNTEGYAIIAGGVRNGGVSNIVDAINASLTVSTAPVLATSVSLHAGCSIQNSCAIIAGGQYGGTSKTEVTIYDDSLTKTTSSLNTKSCGLAGASVGNYAIFTGGTTNGSETYPTGITTANLFTMA